MSRASFSCCSARNTCCSARAAVVPLRATSTLTGSRRCARAKSATSPPVVAEKSSVCRARGSRARMRSSWGLNPMSSMRSASSSTRISTPSRRAWPCWRWSTSRPGVATTTSRRSLQRLVWPPMPTPPMTTAPRTWRPRPKRSSSSPIWRASSRVGASTSARVPGLPPPSAASRSMMGRRKAAVLPGAGGGGADHVPARQRRRDGLGLDGRGVLEAGAVEGVQRLRGELQVGEGGGPGRGGERRGRGGGRR